MAILIARAGGGIYARLQASPDGPVQIEFGEIAGGAFFASGAALPVHAPLYDGSGWDVELVQRLIRHLRPVQAESKRLTALIDDLHRRYPVDLQKHLQLTTKDPDDWARIAVLVRRCAEYGLISDVTLRRYARPGVYPTMVRQAALTALATAI